MITFDDNLKDHYYCFKFLKQKNIPAVLVLLYNKKWFMMFINFNLLEVKYQIIT